MSSSAAASTAAAALSIVYFTSFFQGHRTGTAVSRNDFPAV
jgi:hypothetical protein